MGPLLMVLVLLDSFDLKVEQTPKVIPPTIAAPRMMSTIVTSCPSETIAAIAPSKDIPIVQ